MEGYVQFSPPLETVRNVRSVATFHAQKKKKMPSVFSVHSNFLSVNTTLPKNSNPLWGSNGFLDPLWRPFHPAYNLSVIYCVLMSMLRCVLSAQACSCSSTSEAALFVYIVRPYLAMSPHRKSYTRKSTFLLEQRIHLGVRLAQLCWGNQSSPCS